MIDCMIIGDSIAVGIAQHRQECIAHATVGITVEGWMRKYSHIDLHANTIIISLGSNTVRGGSYSALFELRSKITANTVVWIAPSEKLRWVEYYNVHMAAGSNDDAVVIPNPKHYAPDGIHPTGRGYKILAEETRRK